MSPQYLYLNLGQMQIQQSLLTVYLKTLKKQKPGVLSICQKKCFTTSLSVTDTTLDRLKKQSLTALSQMTNSANYNSFFSIT
eukprot:13131685-Ditylum_brightwellii.AAC.1